MDEQTQSSSQNSGTEEAITETPVDDGDSEATTTDGSVSGDPVQIETDWQHVAELIATETSKKQPTYQTIVVNVFGSDVELRIINQVTVGEMLVSSLLVVAIATFCLRWLFKAVWGR